MPIKSRGNPAVAGKILFAISILFIIASVVSLVEENLFLSKATHTTATVIELSPDRGYRAIFQYEDENGQTFTKASPSTRNPPLYQIGDTADLAYKSGAPSKCRIADRWHTYLMAKVLIIPAGVLLILAAIITRLKKTQT